MEHIASLLIPALAGALSASAFGASSARLSHGPALDGLLGAAAGLSLAFLMKASGQFPVAQQVLAGNPALAGLAGGLAGGLMPPLAAMAFKRGS